MSPDTRCVVAYVVGRLFSGLESHSVFDADRAAHVALTGSVTSQEVNVYDAARGEYVVGSWNDSLLTLRINGGTETLEVRVGNGGIFMGLHRESGWHFEGEVAGDSIRLVDQQAASAFDYSL